MNDMASAIIPKSDQLNSDDLIAGPITIKVTGVTIRGGQEQPVAISYEGDNGKPYKSCKSMNRVLVTCWGADAKQYVGRSMTLYRDPAVKWGGMEVGGIRISHLSDIAEPLTMALTATKGSRKPHTVRPLKNSAPQSSSPATTPGAETGSAEPDRRTAKLARIKENFDTINVSLEALEMHLGKPPVSATGKELEAAFVKLSPQQADDFIADYDAEAGK